MPMPALLMSRAPTRASRGIMMGASPSRLTPCKCAHVSLANSLLAQKKKKNKKKTTHRSCHRPIPKLALRRVATNASSEASEDTSSAPSTAEKSADIERDVSKNAQKIAATFAPRSSTAKKNPAVPGTALHDIFVYQSYLSMAVGGLLAFNVIFPSDEPTIARLLGMWSPWMIAVPSLRARDCSAKEKDALNILFLLIPVINVAIPFVWKSFSAVFVADVIAIVALYYYKVGGWPAVGKDAVNQANMANITASTTSNDE